MSKMSCLRRIPCPLHARHLSWALVPADWSWGGVLSSPCQWKKQICCWGSWSAPSLGTSLFACWDPVPLWAVGAVACWWWWVWWCMVWRLRQPCSQSQHLCSQTLCQLPQAISMSWRRTSSDSYSGPGVCHTIKASPAEVTQTMVAHATTPVTWDGAETTSIPGKAYRGRDEIPDGMAGADAVGTAGHGCWWEGDWCRQCAGSRF